MKAISLWQPWASLMACGQKHFETRSWPTRWRGELAICASKKVVKELGDLEATFRFLVRHKYCPPISLMPTGCVVAVVNVVDCVSTNDFAGSYINSHRLVEGEYVCGDYSPDRFAWITRGVRKLAKPVPVVGRQQMFNLPPEVEAQVRAQL